MIHRIGLFIFSTGLILGSISLANAESIPVAPNGEYAQINTRKGIDAIQTLIKGSAAEKQEVIARVTAQPQNFEPPVFYALAQALFQSGKKDEAAFWFYAGQLRGRFDANRCADISARQAVTVLNQTYGTPINQYTFQDIPKLEALVLKVIAWDKSTPYNYDHRWINLHGMNAMISGLSPKDASVQTAAVSLPKEQWPAIAEKTRNDYLSAFKQAMESLKK